ncbi:MAG: tRNA (adenosine(37)-N6)-threonylcarbamoyltransferase complex ATPase subunit type 1 TsaE [Candidatus Staskawiczbacteria bacterium]|jgi:tRNA threonylcarbamoyladenosine biosynthesis protein TsaE
MQVDKKYTTTSFKQTQKLGKDFALQLHSGQAKKIPQKTATVLTLHGDLGAGKTTFLQGFAKGLGVKEKILSPTYVILKHYKITEYGIKYLEARINSKFKIQDTRFTELYHFDCYRLKNEKDVLELGFKEIISNPKNIVAIEWPERIKKVLPKNIIRINFKMVGENKREITIKTNLKISG